MLEILNHRGRNDLCDLCVLCGLFFLWLAGCGPAIYYVRPPDWKNPVLRDSVISSFEQYYQGRTVFLDPGHGGEDRFNEGPKGEKEADINLRVALYLRDYMERAGAKVIISRTKDMTVALRDRSTMANASDADFFISIHHNSNADEFTNYTSTFYHAVAPDPDYHPSNHDIARYIQRDLSYVLGNSGPLTSFDGTLSDYSVYPLSGFSVLRHTTIPAVLIEGAFFSSKYEERRLKAEEFNEIEAWGIFRGFGRYLEAGFPKLLFLEVQNDTSYRPTLLVHASDSSGVDWGSLTVQIDGEPVPAAVDTSSGTIACVPQNDLSGGEHSLEVIVRNLNGNSSLPFKPRFTVRPVPTTVAVEISPHSIPSDELALAHVGISVRDRKGEPVADSTEVQLSISRGNVPSSVLTAGGMAEAYVRGSESPGFAVLDARSGKASAADTAEFVEDGPGYVTGVVRSALDSTAIGDGRLIVSCLNDLRTAPDSLQTYSDGRFIWQKTSCDTVKIRATSSGYFGEEFTTRLKERVEERVIELRPVARGFLFGKTFLIDPRYGGDQSGEIAEDQVSAADVNLDVSKYLYRLLKASGADVHLLRSGDESIPESSRVHFSKRFKEGFYLRIDASNQSGMAGCSVYRNLTNSALAQEILFGLSMTAQVDTFGVVPSNEQFYYDVAVGTITVVLPSVRDSMYRRTNLAHAESNLAWGIFRGILKNAGYELQPIPVYKKRVVERSTKQPASGVEVFLDSTLFGITDSEGIVLFYDFEGSKGRLTVELEGNYTIREVDR